MLWEFSMVIMMLTQFLVNVGISYLRRTAGKNIVQSSPEGEQKYGWPDLEFGHQNEDWEEPNQDSVQSHLMGRNPIQRKSEHSPTIFGSTDGGLREVDGDRRWVRDDHEDEGKGTGAWE